MGIDKRSKKTCKKFKCKRRKKNKHQTKKKFVKLNCSGGKTVNNFSCYDGKVLKQMKKRWNLRHPDALIRHTNNKKIWKALKDNMAKVCNTERCWLRQEFSDMNSSKKLYSNTFAPYSPKSWVLNPNEWLSSVDIQNVMQQYEEKHEDFLFLGPSPIDFDKVTGNEECVWDELCHFDLKNIIHDTKTKIGIIFNTDPHYSSGSHWISLYVDVDKKLIFYFDSNGMKPPNEVKKLSQKIITQGNDIGINFKYIENNKIHQMSNTECGMYCLYIIISLVENKKKPEYFFKNRVSDEQMEALRKKYFNIVS